MNVRRIIHIENGQIFDGDVNETLDKLEELGESCWDELRVETLVDGTYDGTEPAKDFYESWRSFPSPKVESAAEAYRMLREHPVWNPANRHRCRVTDENGAMVYEGSRPNACKLLRQMDSTVLEELTVDLFKGDKQINCLNGTEFLAMFGIGQDLRKSPGSKTKDVDNVNHPSHYTAYKGIEVIDLTEQMNFNRGNAVKYIARAGLKDPNTEVEDLQKAKWYLEREIARLQKQMSPKMIVTIHETKKD